MSDQSKRLLRGGARAATGLVIIGVAVGAAVAFGTGAVKLPEVERGVVSLEVDTSPNATRTLVCPGAFAELGADPSQPTLAIPRGETQLHTVGTHDDAIELEREASGGTPPRALSGSAAEPFVAIEYQQVSRTNVRGLTATACSEPSHGQWLVGGATSLGVSTTLVLGNPSEVPATVSVEVYTADGRVDASQTTGVLVPAGSQRIVSVNGYAPGQDMLAVKVESVGAAVTATLGVSQVVDIRPYAADTVTSQLEPQTRLVIPGVANVSSHEHTSDEGEHGDEFPVVVRVLAPGDVGGVATVSAMRPNGKSIALGTVELEPGQVSELVVEHWPEQAQAVQVDADVPVVGAVFGSADVAPSHDYAWFVPAPELTPGVGAATMLVTGSELVVANSGEQEAEVTVTIEGAAAPTTVVVPPAAAMTVAARGKAVITSSAPVSAGVRFINGASITGFPVLAQSDTVTSLTVYPRS